MPVKLKPLPPAVVSTTWLFFGWRISICVTCNAVLRRSRMLAGMSRVATRLQYDPEKATRRPRATRPFAGTAFLVLAGMRRLCRSGL